ncbi:uncharacterized protein LOC114174246 [Vigna unguiculata]|uniref:Uncharacterized protein n=1 Tax=Vigna unguiculata TaxID=3917 RepID=A0A4D6LMF6_VIGUN|nr:uncharacterized protein LOC114174246 [Vigna unguiculata]QCD89525.1 hypothetical protein DEO72_LG4g471 [Vigna unguiculata]
MSLKNLIHQILPRDNPSLNTITTHSLPPHQSSTNSNHQSKNATSSLSLSPSHHQNPNPNLLLPLHHSLTAGIPHGRHKPVRPPLLTPERSHHDALTPENPVTAAAPVVRNYIVFSACPAATTMLGLHSPAAECIHEHEATNTLFFLAPSSKCRPHCCHWSSRLYPSPRSSATSSRDTIVTLTSGRRHRRALGARTCHFHTVVEHLLYFHRAYIAAPTS